VSQLGPVRIDARFEGDDFYEPATASADALAFAFLDRGAFVVGDGAASGRVVFWSARWSASNPLSSGSAPSSWKGFAADLRPAPPRAGGRWESLPGNAAAPPPSIPAYMAVIVASRALTSGAGVEGDVVRVVVVRTDPGYGPAPGHEGTGAVVAEIP
jgi:hypothetical protein